MRWSTPAAVSASARRLLHVVGERRVLHGARDVDLRPRHARRQQVRAVGRVGRQVRAVKRRGGRDTIRVMARRRQREPAAHAVAGRSDPGRTHVGARRQPVEEGGGVAHGVGDGRAADELSPATPVAGVGEQRLRIRRLVRARPIEQVGQQHQVARRRRCVRPCANSAGRMPIAVHVHDHGRPRAVARGTEERTRGQPPSRVWMSPRLVAILDLASARTSTVTSADRPARSATSAGGSTQAMRTGTRCTTLTKLPVALSARQQREARAGAAGEALDLPSSLRPGKRVDRRSSPAGRRASGRSASP